MSVNGLHPELSQFMELLIEISDLQRLRHCWADQRGMDDQWRLTFKMLNSMIERYCCERERQLERFAETYPEIRNFTWLQSETFDA